jgi:ubiquinol-cytochrome c reductase subunit 8
MRYLTGSQTQKGVASYALSANRQRPLAGTLNAAIFNTWRRFSHQVLYFAPPIIIAYVTMSWAIERFVTLQRTLLQGCTDNILRNEYLNSKAGRLEYGTEE